jgi:flagellar biosynthetic protein FliO
MEIYSAYLKLLIVFSFTIALTYFCLRFFLQRFGSVFGMGRRIKVMERVVLGTRAHLYVVKVGDEYLLIASAPNGITLLKELGKGWEEDGHGEELIGKNADRNFLSFKTIINRITVKKRNK